MMEYEKDYSLLRQFDLEAAKRGELLQHRCGWGPSFRYLDSDRNGTVCVKSEDGLVATLPGYMIRMTPLCWVEGKPVYKGDVLYGNWNSACKSGYVICGVDEYGIPMCAKNGCSLSDTLDEITWTPTKVKREVKLLAFIDVDGYLKWLVEEQFDRSTYTRVPSEDKVIEIEE